MYQATFKLYRVTSKGEEWLVEKFDRCGCGRIRIEQLGTTYQEKRSEPGFEGETEIKTLVARSTYPFVIILTSVGGKRIMWSGPRIIVAMRGFIEPQVRPQHDVKIVDADPNFVWRRIPADLDSL